MIQELKFSMKLLKYGHQFRMNIVLAGLLFAVGLGLSFLTIQGDEFSMSGCMFATPVIQLVQVLWTLNMARFALVSPRSKRLQTTMPAVLCLLLLTPQYLLVVLIQGVIVSVRPENIAACCMYVFFYAFFVGAATVYAGFCYKYFLFATFALCTVMFSTILFPDELQTFVMSKLPAEPMDAFLPVAVSGLLITWISVALQLGLSKLMYRKPLSRRAQSRELWKNEGSY